MVVGISFRAAGERFLCTVMHLAVFVDNKKAKIVEVLILLPVVGVIVFIDPSNFC